MLPAILFIKDNPAIPVFIVMNSLINLLASYSIAYINVLVTVMKNGPRMDEQIEEGMSQDEAFAEYIEDVDLYKIDEDVPKPLIIVRFISNVIVVLATVIGIIRLVRG